jgi:predicted deacylase
MNGVNGLRNGLAAFAFLAGMAGAHGATVYTGDTIQGIPVISQLDTADLEPGKKHRFYFQGVQMATGQHWYVPLIVAKGAQPGKRIALTAGVHGDELSPIDTVQRAMAQLDPARMSGTVLAVHDMGRPAKELVQRKWPTPQSGGTLVDLNRVWPGDESGGDPAKRQAGMLWNRLLKPNVDVAIDNHTALSGADFAAFIFADLSKPEVRQIAELFPVTQIKNDPGEPGTLETAFVSAGIPSITTEIGAPRTFNRRYIPLFVEGIMNVLKLYKVVDGPMGRTSKEVGTFFGDAFETVRATHGGFLEMLVDLNDEVSPGQKVAIQRDTFGDVIAEYSVTVSGEVSTILRDALLEPGTRIVQVLHDSPDPKCDPSGCLTPDEDLY